MLLQDAQFSLALLATIIIVGCVGLAVSRAHNWIPVAVIVGLAAALFTLIAYKLRRRGKDDV